VGPRAGLDGRKTSSPPGFDPGPIFNKKKIPERNLNIYVCILKQQNFVCVIVRQPYRKEAMLKIFVAQFLQTTKGS